MKDNRKQAKKQAEFCQELMDRLYKSVSENIDLDSSYWGIHRHCQISNDIVRLRRELRELDKLIRTYD